MTYNPKPYIHHNSNYFSTFISNNPEFNTKNFYEYVARFNRADKEEGSLQHIAQHEILRLAYEYTLESSRYYDDLEELNVKYIEKKLLYKEKHK